MMYVILSDKFLGLFLCENLGGKNKNFSENFLFVTEKKNMYKALRQCVFVRLSSNSDRSLGSVNTFGGLMNHAFEVSSGSVLGL